MIREAQEFAEQDKIAKQKFDAKTSLENYIYSIKNTLEDKEKGDGEILSETEKQTINDAVKDQKEWLNDNQDSEKGDYENRLKHLQKICNPIVGRFFKHRIELSDDDEHVANDF
jgi:heat shock protein 5